MNTFDTGQFRPPQKPPRPWVAIGLVFALLVVAANLVGYIVYRGRPKAPSPEAAQAEVTPEPEASDDSVATLAKEQRGNGVAALRAGEYERAIASFDAALRLDPTIEDVKTLREVAERLQKSVPDDEPAPQPLQRPPVARAPRPRRTESRRARAEPPPPPPPPPVLAARVAPSPEPETEPAAVRAPPPPPPPPPTSRELETDERLDLVALVDRGAVEEAAPRTEVAPARTEVAPRDGPRVAPTAGGASPRLVVFWPGRSTSALASNLRPRFSGIDVAVSSNTTALKSAIDQGADAVMASPSVLRSLGLSPALTGAGGDGGAFVVVALKDALTNEALRGATVGMVDELGRKGMPALVAKLIGERAPKLRRVTKVEDLLPLLQFQIAAAVIVRQSDLATLRSRTEQELFTRVLTNHREPLAVGFVDGGRRAIVERAVRAVDGATNRSLGVESWR